MSSERQDVIAGTKLDQAARLYGVEPEYWDIWGKKHQTSPALQKAILGSVGVDVATDASLDHALQQRLWDEWSRPLPPAVVLGQQQRLLTLSLGQEDANSTATLRFQWENGEHQEHHVDLSTLPIGSDAVLQGRRFVRKSAPLPAMLPLGYHELSIRIRDEFSPPSRFIVCPEKAYQPEWMKSDKAAGVAISLYGVRSARNWGCGDLTDLHAILDWAATELGASFIALNPLHAIANRKPYNTSPYLPNSIFYKNFIYLDVERIEDYRHPKRMPFPAAVATEIESLRSSEFVEYERVALLKTGFLKVLFRRFLRREYENDTSRARDFRSFVEREGDLLHLYAVHSALDEALHRRHPDVWNWPSWPAPYQDPESEATTTFAGKNWRSVLFHKYVQWQLDIQLAEAQQYARARGLRIGLYHDLALATDRFGSDLWAHRRFFVSGCRVGAPPDDFSPNGQDWAFPPPNTEQHYQDGYRLFAESIRKNARHGGALRIDHVMRFFRLFWIPDGSEARDGAYVRDRYEDLMHILALESHRQQVIVVGEDLGTVPDETRRMLRQFGVLSYRLFYFERNRDGGFLKPDEYPQEALVSATTHDLPSLAGFWLCRDIESRRQAGIFSDDLGYRAALEDRGREKQKILDILLALKLLPDSFPKTAAQVPELTAELHDAVIGFLASTPSRLFLLNQEDLFKETEQQNLPGTTEEYPNWRRKMKFTVEELRAPSPQAYAAMFRRWVTHTGRTHTG